MRICHILETSGGGSGRVALDLVKAAVTSGDDVTLVYSPVRAEARFVEAARAIEGRLTLVTLPMQRKVGPHDLADLFRLWRLLRRLGPFDVIHSHSSKAGALCRLAGIALPGAQVYTPHAFMSMAPGASRFYAVAEWALSHGSDAIICVSACERRHALETLRIDARRLFVVPNGVEPDYPATRAGARREMHCGEADLVFGFVGRLAPQKNPLRLVEAFAVAARKYPNLLLAVVGDGPLQPAVHEALAARNLAQRVRMLPGRSGRDLMPGFDALVCSSDYEAFSVVFLEALAAGVPIVTTPVGGVEEAVGADETGFIAPDFSAQALAAAMEKFAALPAEERLALGKHSRARAQDFTVSLLSQRTQSVYKTLLSRRS